ncbi:hypothetical protein CKO11_12065 [Rhodobacter sp. TJ_12]|uniref:hypothetical protein n=1 Tax=Rhodobacter sp. TJ_12 TaxID=2029399 RepID=UPI001CBAAA63|nr:hypothetical protein [Rhodobacter sp. TJ_12]MBZ4023192.1 hypothetical protein [Rhodobacter sp. TJ_12]
MDLDRILIDALSDRIVAALKARASRALVVFTEADLGLEPALAGIETLCAAGWTGDWLAAPELRTSVAPRLSLPELTETPRLMRFGLVLVPTLSLSAAAKVATGIADDPVSKVLGEALDRGLRIVAARDGVCPDGRERAARGLAPANPARRAIMSGHLASLAAQGVELCWAARLATTVQGGKATTTALAAPVQQSGIFGWQQARACTGPELRLGRAVRLTPLAAESLSERGIRLIQE